MKYLVSILMLIFFSSTAIAGDYCIKKFGAEKNRDNLTFQTSANQEGLAKELLFTSKNTHLSVLIFQRGFTENESAKTFELLLASRYQAFELSQINPTRLKQQFDFAKKLVFPRNQIKGKHESHLLFSKDDCHFILKQEKWGNFTNEIAFKQIMNSALLF